jgi:hypothetical protein
MKEWIECPFPNLRITDLAEYSSSRIENIEPLIEYEQKMVNSVSRRLCMDIESLETLNMHVQTSILSPNTWLHQKQMVDDYILYTILNDLIVEKGAGSFAINSTEKFSETMVKSMPVLLNEQEDNIYAINQL